jgi:hypothetical protein
MDWNTRLIILLIYFFLSIWHLLLLFNNFFDYLSHLPVYVQRIDYLLYENVKDLLFEKYEPLKKVFIQIIYFKYFSIRSYNI